MRAAAAERAAVEAAAARRRQRRRAVGWTAAAGASVFLVAVLWLALAPAGSTAAPSNPEAIRDGCASCHTTNGNRSEGPTWAGLYRSTVTLDDGQRIVADDAYLRRSITDPSAQIVQNYGRDMPTKPLAPAEVQRLVAFIESLKAG